MKSLLLWGLLLWGAIILEHARPVVFPSGVLTLPLAAGCLFWFRNASGVLLAGGCLLVSWILRPIEIPLSAVIMVGVAAVLLTRKTAAQGWSGRSQHSWLAPVLTILLGLLSHVAVMQAGDSGLSILEAALARVPVAGGMTIAVVFVLRLADEFGLRQSPTVR